MWCQWWSEHICCFSQCFSVSYVNVLLSWTGEIESKTQTIKDYDSSQCHPRTHPFVRSGHGHVCENSFQCWKKNWSTRKIFFRRFMQFAMTWPDWLGWHLIYLFIYQTKSEVHLARKQNLLSASYSPVISFVLSLTFSHHYQITSIQCTVTMWIIPSA